MLFEKTMKIPIDRVGVLIGKSGKTKQHIEKRCCVEIQINSDTGEISIKSSSLNSNVDTFRSIEMIIAIGRGFSPSNAMDLLDEKKSLQVINLKNFAGKSISKIFRIKSRIIGENGKAKRNIERLSNTKISIYGKTVSVIGHYKNVKLAIDTIISLSNGSMHNTVYKKLEFAKKYEKLDKLKLWEDNYVI